VRSHPGRKSKNAARVGHPLLCARVGHPCFLLEGPAGASVDYDGQMRVISVNVGLPREVTWHGSSVSTGIYKEPVDGRVALRKLNLEGDRQADLTVHGGEYKAVYCYPLEHYEYWKRELPGRELLMGVFGENLTVDDSQRDGKTLEEAGLPEDRVHLGDRFEMGSAEVVVTQPRLPCYKLGIRFESDDMVRRFLVSGRTGFYLAVTREGEVGAGDEMKVLSRDPNSVSISEIVRLYTMKRFGGAEVAVVERASRVATFPESWKEYLQERVGLNRDSG
jgi:MOSC domain-containing protein YiiM